jgi:hypothetical protein
VARTAQPASKASPALDWPARGSAHAGGVFLVAARLGARPTLERRRGGVRRRGPLTPALTVGGWRREEVEARRSVMSRVWWRRPHAAPGARCTP